MPFEFDPEDGKVAFIDVRLDGFEIESVQDTFVFWKSMHEIGRLVFEQSGVVTYPVYRFENEPRS